MNFVVLLLLVVVFTLLFVVVAKYGFGVHVEVPASAQQMSQCPDRWNFNIATKMCEPAYSTHCLPFNPSAATLNTVAAKCNTARSCGTDWSGICN
jgi:hypothetical protein